MNFELVSLLVEYKVKFNLKYFHIENK